MKCCKRSNIYTAVQFKPAMVDGFLIRFWDGKSMYWTQGDKEPDPKTVECRIPYVNMPYDREPGFEPGYTPYLIYENSWILTDCNGCIQIWNDKDFRVHFTCVEETNQYTPNE
jgi:hypothetical protein